MVQAKAVSQEFLRYAAYLVRLSRQPARLKPSQARRFNRDQEAARRRRQMARHGLNYWCPLYEDIKRGEG